MNIENCRHNKKLRSHLEGRIIVHLMVKPFGKLLGNDFAEPLLKKGCHFLDAVYIPTLANRDALNTDINVLLKYAKEVVLLYSNALGRWDENCKYNVRIKQINEQISFCSDFRARAENQNIAVKWRPTFDIPLKRSYALYDARQKLYKRILLLDDDIYISEQNLQRSLLALASGYSIVGFHVVNYPDISTIDHIEQVVNMNNHVYSMTGSCMFLNLEQVIGDFLNVYNEDLFFFLTQPDPDKIVSGGTVSQRTYVSWTSLERVKHEQFGDLMYNAFKKRFLGIRKDSINWNKYGKTNEKDILDALNYAMSAMDEIKIQDIETFLKNSNLAPWVSKYLD